MHLIDIVVQPAIFMSVYYTLTLPEIKFLNYYISAPPALPEAQFVTFLPADQSMPIACS